MMEMMVENERSNYNGDNMRIDKNIDPKISPNVSPFWRMKEIFFKIPIFSLLLAGLYEWIYKASFVTMKEYRTHSWPDVQTNAWLGIEPSSGKPYKELDDDYKVPMVKDPYDSCIIVTGGGEEYPQWFGARRGSGNLAYSIDFWR